MPQSPEPAQPWANSPQQTAQIASSNQTANKFLGGRSRSWMNDGTQPPGSSVNPSQVTPRKRNLSSDDSNTDGNGSRRRASCPMNRVPGQINTSDNSINQPVLPSPALTDEPSPAISTQTNSPNNAGTSTAYAVPSQPIVTSDQLPGDGTSPTLAFVPRPPTSPSQGPSDARPGPRPDSQMRERAIASASRMTGPPPPPSAEENTSPAAVSYGTYAPAPTSRRQAQQIQRVQQQDVREERNPRLEAVLARLAQCRYERGLNDSDAGRYKVLRDACEKKDPYYVALHQVFCRWSLDKSAIYSALSTLLSPHDVDHGLAIVERFLKPNGSLSFCHLQWFANFPDPVLEICRLREQLAVWVARFLKQLCLYWERMLEAVVARRYPLLICEMHQSLSCFSITLQPVLFTTSYRLLKVVDANWAMVLTDHFVHEQQCELRMSSSNPPLPADEIDRVRTGFANQYAQIIARAHQQRPSNAGPPSPLTQQYIAAAQRNSRHSTSQQQNVIPNPDAGSSVMAAAPPQRPLPQTPVVPSNGPVYHQPPQAGQPQQPGFAPNPQNQGLQYPPHMPNMPHMPDAQVMTPTPSFGVMATSQAEQQQGAARGYVPQAMPPSQPGLPQYRPPPPQYQARGGRPNGVGGPGRLPRYQNHPSLQTAVTEIHPAEYPMNPYGQHSLQVGLHMVRVRSPKRVPAQSVRARFYQYTKDLVVGPQPLLPQVSLRKLNFGVPAANMTRLTTKKSSSGLPTYHYDEGSYRYRLRICMQPQGKTEFTKSVWAVSACCWPRHIFINLNGTHMTPSRKQHFHKDLPLELTDWVVEGTNIITISFPDVRENQKRGYQYFIGVELVQTNSHDLLKTFITGANSNDTSADEMKKRIKRRMTPLDSDELVIMDEVLRISLTDPFSARMLDIPVRGVGCQHLECFDLENWLRTRPRKQTEKGRTMIEEESEPSLVDDWKCPICGGDARPICLGVDHYLVQVRNELIAKGETNVKAITVTADGEWKAVEEPDEKQENTPTPSISNLPTGDGGGPKTAPVVIELDD